MSDRLGAQVTKDIVDNQASFLLIDLIRAFRAAVDWNAQFLNDTAAAGTGSVDLAAFPEIADQAQQYTADQISTIRSQYAAIAALWEAANGRQAVPEASNFFFWRSKLVGTNVVSMSA